MSKGSTPRPVNRERFDAGWERIYGGDGKSTERDVLGLGPTRRKKGDECGSVTSYQDGGSTPPASNELETDGSKD